MAQNKNAKASLVRLETVQFSFIPSADQRKALMSAGGAFVKAYAKKPGADKAEVFALWSFPYGMDAKAQAVVAKIVAEANANPDSPKGKKAPVLTDDQKAAKAEAKQAKAVRTKTRKEEPSKYAQALGEGAAVAQAAKVPNKGGRPTKAQEVAAFMASEAGASVIAQAVAMAMATLSK